MEVSCNVICTLHYLLSDGLVEPSEAGKVRKYGVRIGGSTYIPFENPRKLEQQLEKIARRAALIKDPYEQSIFLLVHISYLQAFTDVNKRTARLSANIPLIQGNLVPLAFNDVRVEDYMSAMIAVYELQDMRPLVDLYVFEDLEQMDENRLAGLGVIPAQLTEWRRLKRQTRNCLSPFLFFYSNYF